MDNVEKLNARLTLALVCALALFPVAFALLALGSLLVAQDLRTLGEISVLLYVALVAGLASVVFGMLALIAPTTPRGHALGRLALAALITGMVTGIAGLHESGDGCGGFRRAGLECSGD